MNLLKETRQILRIHGVVPKKKLGQNFLVDKEALCRMVSYAAIDKRDIVLEIGAGLGFLTELLADKARRVIAVEIDPKIIGVLEIRLSSRENVTVLQGNILKIDVPAFDKVVSTPPYSISSPLLLWLLEKDLKRAVLAFQEEFAKKLVASPGSADYGYLAVATYYRGEVELLDAIPRDAFWPQPRVGSVIVRFAPRKPPFPLEDESLFFDLTRMLFTQKNRKMRNAILPFFSKRGIPKSRASELADTLPFGYRRPRELTPEEIGLTANEITRKMRELRFS